MDSAAFPPGAIIKVVIPWQGPPEVRCPPTKMPVGKQVLLMASLPRKGKLEWPLGTEELDGALAYPAEEGEVFGMAFWETAKTKLASESDPMWRFITSLAEAAPGTSNENVARVAAYAGGVRPPDVDDFDISLGHRPTRYSTTFVNAVARSSAYHQALVYQALNSWHVFGTADLYIKAVRASATDPTAFPAGVPKPRFWEDTVNSGRVIGWFKHDTYTTSATIDTIATSKNSRVSAYLLGEIYESPGLAELKKLYGVLDDPDPNLRWLLATKLAAWLQEPDHAPGERIETRTSDGTVTITYPGLDASVAYWSARLQA